MKALKKSAMAFILLLLTAPLFAVSAQGPVIKRIEFTSNAPFEIKRSNVVLPAGKYILLQVQQQSPDVFALYQNDLMHKPIAMVQTMRIDYSSGNYPRKTRMLVDMNEEAITTTPVIEGWTIPGDDGWEIISTVMDRNRATIARNYNRHPKQVEVVVLNYEF